MGTLMSLLKLSIISTIIVVSCISSAVAKQQRSYHAIKEFKLEHPCPMNGSFKGSCPGYVIDHIKPLSCGGLDSPKNMQWQTVEDAKQKDKWERRQC